jgi:hypothetical protein
MFTQQDTRKPTIVSEGSSFGTVSEAKSSKDYDIEYWANKTCQCCGEKGHPSWKHTPEEIRKSKQAQQEKNKKKESKESDNESVGSTKSKKSTRSTASKKQANLEKAAKAFATVMVENMGPLREEGYESDSELSH